MKMYLVEVYTERFQNCGLLLKGRSVFKAQKDAKKFITAQKRLYSEEKYRIEFWEISTRRLNAERLAELVVTEDIWAYLIKRNKLIEEWEK